MNRPEQRAHAKLSPSSSERWLNCPASICRAPETDEEAGDAAHEGTAAHAFAEHCLSKNLHGMHALWPSTIDPKYDTPDLRMHIQTYLECVMRLVKEGGDLFIEQHLEIFKEFDVFGTADAVVVTRSGIIHVIDLKYGRGILVDVEENTQLLLYGIGGRAFDFLSEVPVHTIAVHIVQPRRNNLVSKEYSIVELDDWVTRTLPLVKRAFDGVNEANPGSHCKWCPIKATCPERAKMNLDLARFDFDDPESKPVAIDGLSEEELVNIFLDIKLFRDWLDDVEAEVAKRAHDHPVDRLKWVAGRKARKITDEDAAAVLLQEQGIKPYQEPKFLGITEIETQLKLKRLTVKGVLGEIVQEIKGKPALVPATDKREAITPEASAAEDFK